jgi:hypothetical protein
MPIEAWIVAGICIVLELFCIIMMFVLSWPGHYVHSAPFRIPPPIQRQKGGLKPSTMCPPPLPRRTQTSVCPPPPGKIPCPPLGYKLIGHVVMPVTNIKTGINLPKR